MPTDPPTDYTESRLAGETTCNDDDTLKLTLARFHVEHVLVVDVVLTT